MSGVTADRLSYGQQTVLTVNGTGLNGATYAVTGCDGFTATAPATATAQSFTCTPDRTLAVRLSTRYNGVEIQGTPFAVPKPQVTLATTLGTVVVELEPALVPVTVDNFLAYTRSGFYDGTLFHRVVRSFVNQGGAFTAVEAGGLRSKPGVGAPIALESNRGLSNVRGTIAMARTSAPDSATSQFYVNVVDNSRTLDYAGAASPGYAAFGRVVAGLEVMDALNAVATRTVAAFEGVPVTDVFVTSARQTK